MRINRKILYAKYEEDLTFDEMILPEIMGSNPKAERQKRCNEIVLTRDYTVQRPGLLPQHRFMPK